MSFILLKFVLSMKGLLGANGLLNSNYMEQEAALNSLSTLMSIIPGDTYAQFAKVGYIVHPFFCSFCNLSDGDSYMVSVALIT